MIYKSVDIEKSVGILSFSSVFKIMYMMIFRQKDYSSIKDMSEFNIVYTYEPSKRDDYDDIIKSFVNCCPVRDLRYYSLVNKISFCGIASILICIVTMCISSLWFGGRLNFKDKLLERFAKSNIDKLSSVILKSNGSVLVTFCDANFEDNLIAQFAKSMGYKTITLQHGQYHLSCKDNPENLALKNIVSDYLFSWGDATKNEYYKYLCGQSEIVSIGILSDSFRNKKNYINNRESQTYSGFTVFLNADNCFKHNLEMLSMVNDFCIKANLKFFVKYHPKNSKKKYVNVLNKLHALSDSALPNTISIVYTSGVIVKLLCDANTFLLFKNNETPSIYMQNIMGFSSTSELAIRYNEIINCNDKYVSIMEKSQTLFIAEGDSFINCKRKIKGIVDDS